MVSLSVCVFFGLRITLTWKSFKKRNHFSLLLSLNSSSKVDVVFLRFGDMSSEKDNLAKVQGKD